MEAVNCDKQSKTGMGISCIWVPTMTFDGPNGNRGPPLQDARRVDRIKMAETPVPWVLTTHDGQIKSPGRTRVVSPGNWTARLGLDVGYVFLFFPLSCLVSAGTQTT
jgi:hypothetical protein